MISTIAIRDHIKANIIRYESAIKNLKQIDQSNNYDYYLDRIIKQLEFRLQYLKSLEY